MVRVVAVDESGLLLRRFFFAAWVKLGVAWITPVLRQLVVLIRLARLLVFSNPPCLTSIEELYLGDWAFSPESGVLG